MGKCRRVLPARQRGTLRHLLQDLEVDDPHLRRLEPPCECSHEWGDHMPPLPWSVELRSPQDRCQPHSLPSPALLYDRICSTDFARFAAVPGPHRARVDTADVRCQKHDVRCRPSPWSILDRSRLVPWSHVIPCDAQPKEFWNLRGTTGYRPKGTSISGRTSATTSFASAPCD